MCYKKGHFIITEREEMPGRNPRTAVLTINTAQLLNNTSFTMKSFIPSLTMNTIVVAALQPAQGLTEIEARDLLDN